MKTTIEAIADTIDVLRRSDVFCLINMSFDDERNDVADYIKAHRPDLVDEVNECLRALKIQ